MTVIEVVVGVLLLAGPALSSDCALRMNEAIQSKVEEVILKHPPGGLTSDAIAEIRALIPRECEIRSDTVEDLRETRAKARSDRVLKQQVLRDAARVRKD